MNKIFALVLAVLLVPLAASAYWGNGLHHEMEDMMEKGTFQDLQDYRDSVGFNMMPWVDSEEDFEYAKERHEIMEENHAMPCHRGGHHMGHGWN